MIRDGFWFLSHSVCVFYHWALGRWQKNNELEKSYTIANHLSSYYHMFYHVFCQTTNSTFSVNIVVVSRTRHLLQDQELEQKKKWTNQALQANISFFSNFWSTYERKFIKKHTSHYITLDFSTACLLFCYFFNLRQSFDFIVRAT